MCLTKLSSKIDSNDMPKAGTQVNTLYRRLKEAFNDATDQELARRLNVSKQAVSQWKSGASQPSERVLIHAASITGTQLGWLLTGLKTAEPGFLRLDLPEYRMLAKVLDEEFKRVAKLEEKDLAVLMEEVAREIGVDQRSLYNFRSGKWPLPAAIVPRLCQRFGSTKLVKALL